MYWIYTPRLSLWNNELVQADLVVPLPQNLSEVYNTTSFHSPIQDEPYGVDISLTYQVNSGYPHPDYYPENAGFTLFSKRLIDLMSEFEVRAEIFPVNLVDQNGHKQTQLQYYVFHQLEGILDAMDEERSEWTGDHDIGIPRLVLNESHFSNRPLFVCEHIYIKLMRDDLKQEIQNRGITGFAFLSPHYYRSGKYGVAPASDEEVV